MDSDHGAASWMRPIISHGITTRAPRTRRDLRVPAEKLVSRKTEQEYNVANGKFTTCTWGISVLYQLTALVQTSLQLRGRSAILGTMCFSWDDEPVILHS